MKKTVIITGANRGLGKGFIDNLIEADDCFIISMSRSLAKEQENYPGDKFYFLKTDLAVDNIPKKLDEVRKILGNEAIFFISNAGIIEPVAKIEHLNEGAIDKALDVNIKSTILISKYLLQHFGNNKLTFVNISSGAASRPIRNWAMYCSAKAYIKMFFEVAESEYSQHKFYNINPGVLDTGMQKTIRQSDFPDVDNFRKLEEDNELKSPIKVAKDILKTTNII